MSSGDVPSATSGGTADLLPQERKGCSFDITALKTIVAGPAAGQPSGFEHLFDDPVFDDSEDAYQSYIELFSRRQERAARAMQLVHENPKFKLAHQGGKVPMGRFIASSGISIHFSMFMTFVRTQASKEQQQAWLGKAVEGRFLGAYAQTELGHGSNIRALETTATFDPATDEFVIHSPTLTSMKWWPTGIYSCTHAAVMAQLIIEGKSLGFHGFLVQLRDDKGYCMPGVEVGEMGPKFDAEHNYIGYARFTHVRIPRFNMFAKNQQVTRAGEYIPAPAKINRFKYISMMETRVAFVGMSGLSLGRAATIAIRYSCVRQQGFVDTQAEDPFAAGEHRIMEYRMQQYRTFKGLGLSYMFIMNHRWIRSFIQRVQKAVNSGDLTAADELPELHASCAGLKVWSTLLAHESIEDLRRACGGQGFLRSAGIGDLFTEFGVAVTGEGEQVILSMQVARFLIKAVREVKAGKDVAGTVRYLKDGPMQHMDLASAVGKPERLVEFFRDRARRFALDLEARFSEAMLKGTSFDSALNSVAVFAYKAVEVHCIYILCRNFCLAIEEFITEPACAAAVRRLAELVLLQLIREQAGDWIGSLDSLQLGAALDRLNSLLGEVRPDAVGLSDALGNSDRALRNSTLGRYDGKVYEEIYARAKLSPLNKPGAPMLGWEHLAQVLDLDFLREGMQTQRCEAAGMPAASAKL